jgi:L-galactose dehydrogenase/L-glyceraldehyde 3-phosphate reductase
MRRTLLGRTGLEISELAFGAGVTGGILIDADEGIRDAVLRRAVAAGINWIDTAPVYGDGASEETIGRHLRGLSPRPHISTKVRLEAEDLGDIAGALERSLEQSLRRLQFDRVALLQLHNHLGGGVGGRVALSPAQVLARGGVADTLDRLKQQGLVGAIGLTAAGDTRACLQVIDSGRFDTAQVYYNAINPSAAWKELPRGWRGGQDFCGILAACTRHGMGVLNIRTWAGGVLASAARPARLFVMTANTDADNEVRCASAVRATLGDAYGTPAQAALRFALRERGFATRVIGIGTIAQLDPALAALAEGPLPPAAMSKLEALWSSGFGPD